MRSLILLHSLAFDRFIVRVRSFLVRLVWSRNLMGRCGDLSLSLIVRTFDSYLKVTRSNLSPQPPIPVRPDT